MRLSSIRLPDLLYLWPHTCPPIVQPPQFNRIFCLMLVLMHQLQLATTATSHQGRAQMLTLCALFGLLSAFAISLMHGNMRTRENTRGVNGRTVSAVFHALGIACVLATMMGRHSMNVWHTCE
jgi:hypothetical protein